MKNQHVHFYRNRRRFLKTLTIGLGSTMVSVPLLSFNQSHEHKAEIKPNTKPIQDQKMGIALVGLGQYSSNQLAPALQEAEHCYLAGIVTGTPAKADAWKAKYEIPEKNIYNYENFDQIADNEDIDIVYVVLPISMHAEYTIRAAKAKKHVICEKPMAMNAVEAQKMVDACGENGVQLAIGYRLHFEPFNKRVMELGQQQVYGKVKSIQVDNSSDMTDGNPDVWRLRKDLAGGGPLMDLGIYCVQGACYTLGKLPVAVTAQFGEVTNPAYFYEVEESVSWEMEFEDGVVAKCTTSYADEDEKSLLSAEAENGWWKVDPSYAYDDKEGETNEGRMDHPNVYEQVHQMDGQAQSFLKNKKSIVPGEMGVNDMKILMAIYESAQADGKKVKLEF
ncbi:Gfo/Idh/MocA family oxidoreductase [soil metagenome]